MCLAIVAIDATPHYPFVIAANRDEQHERPTDRARWWPEAPPLLGGRDRVAGGTWLAVDRAGRVAAVTNVRGSTARSAPRSRGGLVTAFLRGQESPAEYAARLQADAENYNAFNLLLYGDGQLVFASNRAAQASLEAGVHAVSNAPWGVEWPKMASGRAGVERVLDRVDPVEPLFELLAEQHAGVTDDDRYRRSHFILGAAYGTRCSTVVTIATDGTVTFAERSFDGLGRRTGEVHETFTVT